MNRLGFIIALIAVMFTVRVSEACAGEPIYIVNGREYSGEEMKRIDPAQIVRSEQLPVDEALIARYGQRASDGVIVVTLKYDTPPSFPADPVSFNHYIEQQVDWGEDEMPARVIYRYVIRRDGTAELTDLIESTDNRLRGRVVRAVRKAPKWIPAKCNGEAVEVEQVLNIRLPHRR